MQYHDGSVLTQRQFVEFVLSIPPEEVTRVVLVTMSYSMPLVDGLAIELHKKLLALADAGVCVEVLIDNTYGNRIEPGIDIPPFLAKLTGHREQVEKKESSYAELRSHNIALSFTGSEHPPLFPLSKIDHRKILFIEKNGKPDFGMIFGFNINYLVETGAVT